MCFFGFREEGVYYGEEVWQLVIGIIVGFRNLDFEFFNVGMKWRIYQNQREVLSF